MSDEIQPPAVENPRTWATVAEVAESVGADARSVWVVEFEDDEGEPRTVLTETLRGSDVDGGVGLDDLESDARYSIHVEDIRRVRPVLDSETGDPLDSRDADLGDLWERMDIDALLDTLGGPLCPGCKDERTYMKDGEPVYCGLCSEEKITDGYRNPVGR